LDLFARKIPRAETEALRTEKRALSARRPFFFVDGGSPPFFFVDGGSINLTLFYFLIREFSEKTCSVDPLQFPRSAFGFYEQ
jgi:hypothetical protein